MGVMHKNTPTTGLTNPAAAAETAVYTTPALQVGAGDGLVGVSGTINVTPGTAATACVIRVRQGSITGTQVGPTATHTVAAGAPQSISFGVTDTSGYLQGVGSVYVVTITMTSATGATTVNFLDIEVLV